MRFRKANLEPPKNIHEARQRSIEVRAEIEALEVAIDARFRYREDDGMPMNPEEHFNWRRRARIAMEWLTREKVVLDAWIKDYEKDLRAEEDADRRREKREAAKESARLHYESQKSYQEWQERMIQEHGTARAPAHVFRAQQVELEELRAERRQQVLAMQENSERLRRRKQAHKEWLKALEIEDPVNGLDPENLLRHAYRALRRIVRIDRSILTEDEQSLLNAIEQRHLILADLTES